MAISRSESKKRKKEEADGNVQSTSASKKAKVHAQRKFAQGATVSSPSVTPIKDRDKQKPANNITSPDQLLTSKRPNTEDFLTFLCFRRTSILPPRLDFFNDVYKPDEQSPEPGTSVNSQSKSKLNNSENGSQKICSKKILKNSKVNSKQQPVVVQALKQKYQQQRLAKQKPIDINKLAQKVKGKNMMRTRSAVVAVPEVKQTKPTTPSSVTKPKSSGLRSGLQRTPVKVVSKTANLKGLRIGLRSSSRILDGKSRALVRKAIKQLKPTNLIKKVKKRKEESKVAEEFSSDDNEPLLTVKKPKIGLQKKIQSRVRSNNEVLSSTRPTRKTKEAAAIYMEMLTKKLVSPDRSGEDDQSSVDSFPELPNAKRNEQRESEIKAEALAKKKKVIEESVTKTKSDDKKFVKPGTIFVGAVRKSAINTVVGGSYLARHKRFNVVKIRRTTRSQKQEEEEDYDDDDDDEEDETETDEEQNKPTKGKEKKIIARDTKKFVSKKNDERLEPMRTRLGSPPVKSVNKNEEKKVRERSVMTVAPDDKKTKKKILLAKNKKQNNEEGGGSKINKVKKKDEVEVRSTRQNKTENETRTTRQTKPNKTVSEENENKQKEDNSRLTRSKEKSTPQLVKKIKKRSDSVLETEKLRQPVVKTQVVKVTKNDSSPNRSKVNEDEKKVNVKEEKQAKKVDEVKNKEPKKTEEKAKSLEVNKGGKILSGKLDVEKRVGGAKIVKENKTVESNELIDVKKLDEKKVETVGKEKEIKLVEAKNESVDVKRKVEQQCMAKVKTAEKRVLKDTKDDIEPVRKLVKPDVEAKNNVNKSDTKDNKLVGEITKEETKLSSIPEDKPAIVKPEVVKILPKTVAISVTVPTAVKEKLEAEVTVPQKVPEKLVSPSKTVETVKATKETDSCKNMNDVAAKDKQKKAVSVVDEKTNATTSKQPAKTLTKNKNDEKEKTREKSIENDRNTKRVDDKEESKEKASTSKEKRSLRKRQARSRQAVVVNKIQRPVRQCSTGEKLWIESDSDSDDDSFQLFHIMKNLERESLEAQKIQTAKQQKQQRQLLLDESTKNKEKVDLGDHFTDSDEEPLHLKTKTEVSKEGLKKLNRVDVGEECVSLNSKNVDGKSEISKLLNRQQTVTRDSLEISDFCDAKSGEGKSENSATSVPTKIEKILESLKTNELVQTSQPVPASVVVVCCDVAPVHYTYSYTSPEKTDNKLPPQPINTHGLDLLSEVAPLTVGDKANLSTERIEKWLKESMGMNMKKGYSDFEMAYKCAEIEKKLQDRVAISSCQEVRISNKVEYHVMNQPQVVDGAGEWTTTTPAPAGTKPELLTVQQCEKKKNIEVEKVYFGGKQTDVNKNKPGSDSSGAAKKTLTSVQDLLKLQKVRKEMKSQTTSQQSTDNTPHSRNCKCNNCVVKKGWFKNKVMPVVSPTKADIEKPFQTLTNAFTKLGENKEKISASVAPIVQPSTSHQQQRKFSFLERMKERERKASLAKLNVDPFSPNNENSVYAFEPDHEFVSPSFRSKTRDSRTSSTTTSRSEEDLTKLTDVSDDVNKEKYCSSSIAVQVNLDTESVSVLEPTANQDKSTEISTQTEVAEDDSDSHMFYIPLQSNAESSSTTQQLIQGVALKVGTEGPMGPNQRVIMKAKLVTKAPTTPTIQAVVLPQQQTQQKRVFETNSKSNNPPVGTVQPTIVKPLDEETRSDTLLTESDTTEQSSDTRRTKSREDESPGSSTHHHKTKRTRQTKETRSELVEAPIFRPTEKEFQDPLEYIEKITPLAESYGLCKIIPPASFKPDCKVNDNMRFTAYNQYVCRMLHRWGPNVKEMMAIKKYLATQSISLKQPPWIGGIEVDLPRLYQCVQNCGGLMKVMEKKKWNQVADSMRIPRAAQDRVTKLDDIYCKYLLPYDTLSPGERQKLFDEVEADWQERQRSESSKDSTDTGDDESDEETYIDECEECIVRGKNMALNQFYRIARNTMSMWFKNAEPTTDEVVSEYWNHVTQRNNHVCVHSGSIDSSGCGYGFPITKNNPFSKHPWNLKVLTNNPGSVLRSLGPVMGVTVPTLHVGMVFTAFCWYRDPHHLPWIEYLHTGGSKIWYGISDDNSSVFREALKKLLPRYIKNKTIWLPSDTAMVPPDLLVEHGVSLCHTIQEPGQFILVFPRAFTSSICTGYLVSESVYFAQSSWLTTAEHVFNDIQESCEPSMFSLERLLFSIATDSRTTVSVLKQVLPMVWHVRQKEIDNRKTLFNLGLKTSERLPLPDYGNKKKGVVGRWAQDEDGDYECNMCRANLYVSLVTNSQDECAYCLPHAIQLLTQKRHHLKYCKLMYAYSQEEMNEIIEKLEQKIETKSQKKLQSKSSSN